MPEELTPEALQARTFEVLRHIALQASRQTPLLLVVEDAHWIDRTSEAFLTSLAEVISGEPILLLFTYRPGYRPTWIGSPNATQIALSPLSPDESLNVVRAVMRSEEVPADVAASILARAEGNPFFLEELARAAGRPDALGAATTSLEAVLSARIEALPEACRRVLRTASVLGRHFSRRLLDGVWTSPESPEPQLRELKRLDLLHERVRLDDASYSFKHALIQEAAYEGLSASERQALHAAVARTLEALHAGRPDEACELIAHHYLRSAETEKALSYLELSNRKAARASAMAEAKGYFDEAMKLLDRRPDTAETRRRRIALVVDQVLAMTLLFRFDEYRELLQRHESMAMALEEAGLRGAFLAARGVCEWAVGEYDRAIGTFAQAAELCEAAGYADGAALAYSVRQWAHLYKGDYEAVLALLPSVARVLDGRSSPRWRAYALGAASRACTYRGLWDQATDFAREELALAERFADDSLAAHAALTLALAEAVRGDLEHAVEHGELALRKASTPADRTWANAILGLGLVPGRRTGAGRRGSGPHRGAVARGALAGRRVLRGVAERGVPHDGRPRPGQPGRGRVSADRRAARHEVPHRLGPPPSGRGGQARAIRRRPRLTSSGASACWRRSRPRTSWPWPMPVTVGCCVTRVGSNPRASTSGGRCRSWSGWGPCASPSASAGTWPGSSHSRTTGLQSVNAACSIARV